MTKISRLVVYGAFASVFAAAALVLYSARAGQRRDIVSAEAIDRNRSSALGGPGEFREVGELSNAGTIALRGTFSGTGRPQATIEVGRIAPENAMKLRELCEPGVIAGKPSASVLELIRFDAPLPVATVPDGDGNAIMMIPNLEAAAVYRIQAIRVRDDAWYHVLCIPASGDVPARGVYDVGVMHPILAAGLRVLFENAGDGQEEFLVTLERLADPQRVEEANVVLRRVEQRRPDILDAITGKGSLKGSASEPFDLAPLPPDPAIRLHFLTMTGLEGSAVDIALEKDTMIIARVNLAEVFRGLPTGIASLRGRLLLGNTEKPIEGAVIEREGAPLRGTQRTTTDGSFTFSALPPGVRCKFRVTIPRGDAGQSSEPRFYDFDYTPPADSKGAEQSVEWRVPER